MAKTETKTPAADGKRLVEGEKVHRFFRGIHKKSANIRKEFVEFINRGSVVDLAIGVAVGGAFNTIVNSLVNDIVMPIVGLLAGGVDFNNLAIRIPNFFGANDEAVISYGKFLQACLQFLIIAWVFFLIVKAMNGFHQRREAELLKIEKRNEQAGKSGTEKLETEVEKTREAEKTKAEVEKAKEMEKTKAEAGKTKTETVETKAGTEGTVGTGKMKLGAAEAPVAKTSKSRSGSKSA